MNLVEIFKTLGDENRIRIINLLMKCQLCVCEVETILDITQSNASRHLNKLKSIGIIVSEKESQWVYYKMSSNFIEENKLLYEFLKNKIEQNKKWQKDIDRLNKYKNSDFTCGQLRENKDKVLEYLKG